MTNALRLSMLGAIGGLFAWFLCELIFGDLLLKDLPLFQKFALDVRYGLVSGSVLGLILGIGHSLLLRRWWLIFISTALGAVGGIVGLVWGEALYQVLKFAELPARAVGWAILGFALGSSQGASRGSMLGALRAGLGGGIGGGIGGILFAILPSVSHLPDSVSRGIAWVLMGSLIGSASALFERLLAVATLKIASGKLEGKEFILDKSRLVIGRDERCDIAIYYDPAIQPKHVTIEWTGAGYRIAPIGNASIIVNGQSVPIKELDHNDVVIVGNTRLVYRLRAGLSKVYLCASCYAPNRKSAKFCLNCGKPFVPLDLPKEPVLGWLLQALMALGVLLLCIGFSYGLGNWLGQARLFVTVTQPTQPANIIKQWKPKPLRLAVTPVGYDDIGSVLRHLGFNVEQIGFEALYDLAHLRNYDAVFVNCHEDLDRFESGQAIERYVAKGGVLYASDYACDVIKAAFPHILDFGFSGIFAFFGEVVDARVIDHTLIGLVGHQVRLNFDMPAWRHVSSWHPSCRVYLVAEGWLTQKALLVSFAYGQGFVIYTAFHNKAQPSEIERRLIEFLAIRPLTMRLSHQIAQEITRPVEVGALGEHKATGLLTGRQMVMRREIVGTLGTAQSSPIYRFQLSQPSLVKVVVGWEGGSGEFVLTIWSEANPQRKWRQVAQLPPLILTVTEPLPTGPYCLQLTAIKAPLPKTPFVIGVGLAQ
ncbi:MAG: FHA domain-containing protein [Armatimonadetes bacterium]|nr:FHA domain-containing protein [Armatimonadota bacterium]